MIIGNKKARKEEQIKAYRVYSLSEGINAGLLVYANSEANAITRGYYADPGTLKRKSRRDIQAERLPSYDRFAGARGGIIYQDKYLPEGAKPFYGD